MLGFLYKVWNILLNLHISAIKIFLLASHINASMVITEPLYAYSHRCRNPIIFTTAFAGSPEMK